VRRVWWGWVDGKAGCGDGVERGGGRGAVVKSVFWPLKRSREVHGGDRNSHLNVWRPKMGERRTRFIHRKTNNANSTTSAHPTDETRKIQSSDQHVHSGNETSEIKGGARGVPKKKAVGGRGIPSSLLPEDQFSGAMGWERRGSTEGYGVEVYAALYPFNY
jgi:hypothetical protein